MAKSCVCRRKAPGKYNRQVVTKAVFIPGDSVIIGCGVDVIRRRTRLLAIAACALVLVGCGGGTPDNTSTPPAPATTATERAARPTPPPAAAELLAVTWTTDVDPATGAPRDDVDAFPSDAAAIIAAVECGGLAAGTELTATWSIDGTEVPEATMRVTVDRTISNGWATFRFTRDPERRFPLGELQVRVTASDGTEVTGTVDIVLP